MSKYVRYVLSSYIGKMLQENRFNESSVQYFKKFKSTVTMGNKAG